MRKIAKSVIAFACSLFLAIPLAGCSKTAEGVTEIEIVQYKPEAAAYFEKVEKAFNEQHKDIHLTIYSPNDAATVLKTRFIREDYPDIIGIGGDINYSYYVDAGILADISDYQGVKEINPAYLAIDEALKIVPVEGVYALPYAANAAGILYNKDLFDQYGWEIPTNWEELMSLCEEIQSDGVLPFYFGFKDIWTCLAPWNAMAVSLSDTDTAKQVNRGETTFSKAYRELAEKYIQILDYGPKNPFAYNYNDACTAFARQEAAMFTIGSYAIPQILSVNPDLNLDSFVLPASESSEGNVLNSGIDLQFCVTAECEKREAAYEVLDFLYQDENIQDYINEQTAIPCKSGEFEISPKLNSMKPYIEEGRMADFHDHYYPSEMAADALLQTYLIKKDTDQFLSNWDKIWPRYNRDIIRAMEKYEEEN